MGERRYEEDSRFQLKVEIDKHKMENFFHFKGCKNETKIIKSNGLSIKFFPVYGLLSKTNEYSLCGLMAAGWVWPSVTRSSMGMGVYRFGE